MAKAIPEEAYKSFMRLVEKHPELLAKVKHRPVAKIEVEDPTNRFLQHTYILTEPKTRDKFKRSKCLYNISLLLGGRNRMDICVYEAHPAKIFLHIHKKNFVDTVCLDRYQANRLVKALASASKVVLAPFEKEVKSLYI